jgi:hypothetical protein
MKMKKLIVLKFNHHLKKGEIKNNIQQQDLKITCKFDTNNV